MYKVEVYKIENPFITNNYTGEYFLNLHGVIAENADEAVEKVIAKYSSHLIPKLIFKVKEW